MRLNGSEKGIFNVFIGRKFIIGSWVLQWWLKRIVTPVWRYTENKTFLPVETRRSARLNLHPAFTNPVVVRKIRVDVTGRRAMVLDDKRRGCHCQACDYKQY